MKPLNQKGMRLLLQGIWPGEQELVVGVVDEETGVISEEIRIQPGQKIPQKALKLIKEQLDSGKDPLYIPFEPGGYSRDTVQRAVGKGRN